MQPGFYILRQEAGKKLKGIIFFCSFPEMRLSQKQ